MSAARLGRIADRLREETSRGGVGSASILVARHARVVLHQGFGRLNRGPGAPATRPDTLYIVASISKPVSVCGLMLLVDEGRVALDDRVQRYLPEFQGRLKERVLVRHLLSHTSGLPDMVPENTQLRRAHAPLSEFVAAALRTPLLFEPGTRFSYQSMGTLLAAEIAERVSGMRLRDLLRSRIFRPLGMQRTMLGLQGPTVEETAIFQENGNSEDSRRWGPNSPYWRAMGHPWGGLHATAGDLASPDAGLSERRRLRGGPGLLAGHRGGHDPRPERRPGGSLGIRMGPAGLSGVELLRGPGNRRHLRARGHHRHRGLGRPRATTDLRAAEHPHGRP